MRRAGVLWQDLREIGAQKQKALLLTEKVRQSAPVPLTGLSSTRFVPLPSRSQISLRHEPTSNNGIRSPMPPNYAVTEFILLATVELLSQRPPLPRIKSDFQLPSLIASQEITKVVHRRAIISTSPLISSIV